MAGQQRKSWVQGSSEAEPTRDYQVLRSEKWILQTQVILQNGIVKLTLLVVVLKSFLKKPGETFFEITIFIKAQKLSFPSKTQIMRHS